ncbi:sulfatase [Micromonospora sp. NBC_01796]|uniref:sulfatase n=1 Tax=Micromonospora sp. NBC_01796 TaxID=2975987 RepID=UPI002DD7CBEA|nr:sulfatase [Micromonospora sp. NBC_01796]WSA84760.1 sulfatase [Micromonospora sp. NBC_01796]
MDDLSTTHDSATDNRAEIVPADDATSPSTKADADAGPPAEATVAADNTVAVRRKRRILAGVTTTLAVLLVLFALVAPNQIGRLSPAAFLRIPLEGLVGVALLLVLPGRTRRVVAAIVGVALGLLTIVKIIDMGFFEVLDRPFDLVLDWVLLDDALSFLTDSIGRFGAIAAAIGLALLVVAVLVLMTLSVLRLTRPLVRHRTTAARSVAALGAVWVTCAVLGAQIVPGVPVAANSAADLAYDRTLQVRAGLRDQSAFAEEVTVDAFRDTPGDRLLTGLRGKDVIFAFVESYGRDAVEDPEMAPQVGALLDAGNQRLNAAGFASRSAFLTSPTAGGGSWLAHATLLSGLWIDNQQRHNNLLASDRLTLNGAFRRADWRTVAVMPALTQPWPEGKFFGNDQVYGVDDLGYHGPKFSYAPVPDQFTLSAFERFERANPDHAPVMAEIPLVSSHGPWAPIPRMVGWNELGDGSVYNSIAKEGESPDDVWRDPSRVRTEYRRSIEYSLSSLISYVENYGDDNLVLVFLGDHQPAPIVTGENASRDVPITIVAHDPAVLDRVSGWGWQDGLRPGPQAPVWRMDAFRDRFLTAFGS